MSVLNKQDVITDDALEAPLILRKNFESLLEAAKEVIESAKDYNDQLKKGVDSSEGARKKTKELTEEQKLLAQITKAIATETAKQSEAYQEQVQILAKLKSETKEMGANRDLTRKFDAEHASITELNQALNANRVAYSALRGEHERNSAAGKKLLATIQQQDEELTKLNRSIGKVKDEAGNLRESLASMFEKSGEGGEKFLGIMGSVKSAITSGWTLVGTAVAAATGAVEQFFERMAEGEREHRLIMAQMSIQWEIFKNRAASAGSYIWDKVKDFAKWAEADDEAKEVHRKQRYATASEEERKRMDIEDEQRKKAREIAIEKDVLFKKELANLEKNTEVEFEAAKLRLEYSDKENLSKEKRLEAAREENKILTEQGKLNVEIAKAKAEITKQEVINNKGILYKGYDSLTQEEKKTIFEAEESFKTLQNRNVLEQATRVKRISRIALEGDRKEKTKPEDFSLYEKDVKDLEDLKLKVFQENEKKRIDGEKQAAKDEEQERKDELAILEQQEDQYMKEELRKADERYEHYKEKEKELVEKKKELAKVAADSIVAITNSQFESQVRSHEFYLGKLKENYQEEMQLASGNKIAQAQLTKEFREKEKREENEIRKLKRQQAKFDRDVALLQIALSTAVAVMKDVEKYPETKGEPFATMDLAIGALMETAVLARPLPSYQFGTQGKPHKGGKALTGEVGFELYKIGSEIGLTENKPNIAEWPRGTEFFPHDETLRMLAMAGLGTSFATDRQIIFNSLIVNELNEIRKAIGSKKEEASNFYSMMAGYYQFKKQSGTFAKKILIEKFGN